MGINGDSGQARGHRAAGHPHAPDGAHARDEAQEHARGQAPRGFGTAGRDPVAAADHASAADSTADSAGSVSEETRPLRPSDPDRPPHLAKVTRTL